MSRRLRILLLNQYLPPDAAATAFRLADLAQDLARDHEVWVVAGRPSYNPGQETFRDQSVRVVRVGSTTFPRTTMWGRAANYLSFLSAAAARALTLPRPDVVVAMTDPPVIGVVGALVARRRRARFVQVYMDSYPDVAIALHRADNPALVWVWRRLNGYVRRTADRIVVIGRDMRERLLAQGVPDAKIVVRPNWAADEPVSAEDVATARTARGWDGLFVLMFAGNLGLAQGLDALVAAAARLRDHPGLRFVLVGDGAAKARLERRAAELGLSNLEFLPYVPQDEARVLAAAADAHVITLAPGLLGTATPGKVYSIMAAGKPFVAAVERGSEIDRMVRDHGCGIRVDPGDAVALSDAVLSLRGRPDAGEMGRRGRAAFEASYTREAATRTYRELLEELSTGSPDLEQR